MANTFDATLVTDTLAERVKTKLSNVLVSLRAFSRDYSTKVYNQGQSHIVSMTTAGSATLTNPTNFEQGNSTKVPVPITINHYSQPFHVTSAELNSRHKLEDLADRNLQTLGDTILGVAFAPITAANFTSGSGIIAQTALAVSDLQAGWAAIAKSPEKHCILDGVAFSKFLPTSKDSFTPGAGAYGFHGFHLNTNWTGAEAGVYGFIAGPDSICMASGIPDIAPAVQKLLMESRLVTIEGLGLTVQLNVWGSLTSRAMWASYDLFFGAAFGKDTDAGYRIRSA